MSQTHCTIVCVIWILAASVQSEYPCVNEGLMADPDNCQQFIFCSYAQGPGGFVLKPTYQSCSDTELFNDVALVCDFPENVDCGDRPLPGGSTQRPTSSSTMKTTGPTDATKTSTTTITSTRPPPTNTPPPSRYPDKIVMMYLVLADDTKDGYHTDDEWNPGLYDYQINGANVLVFTFINPKTMTVPKSFANLAATRGTGQPGAVPADTKILFAIGGYLYSIVPNPWEWLTSKEKAEAMADQVAQWKSLYGIDGIDLDIEGGAGDRPEAGPNMIHFIRRLRHLVPDFIIGQPTYGYPQVQAEIDVINASWKPGGGTNNLADSIGLMVYEGTQSLDYVENYAHGTQQWEGFPITVDVPYNSILVGCKGISNAIDIDTLAKESQRRNLLGIMVWYASVIHGFQYEVSWDASQDPESQAAFVAALQYFQSQL